MDKTIDANILLGRINRKVVSLDNGCWEWEGTLNEGNYGVLWDGRVMARAHRIIYRIFFGFIPNNREIDHLCRNTKCVNPYHLDIVTHRENVRRGNSGILTGMMQRAKTHCPQGHPYDTQNTYINPSGKRNCRTCMAESNRRYKGRNR